MSSSTYKYGYKISRKRRPRKALLVIVLSTFILGIIGGVIYIDIKRRVSPTVEGDARVVSQVLSEAVLHYTIDEPLYTFELPGDWEEVERRNTRNENSITWQATREGHDNRMLTLYVDTIPSDKPLNRLLPIKAQGNGINYANVSDNCATFTDGGTLNTREAVKKRPSPAKWQEVNFICNLENVVDNVVGTGTVGSPVNTTSIRGVSGGEHTYFFVYIDRNIQPNYSILYEALASFRAK